MKISTSIFNIYAQVQKMIDNIFWDKYEKNTPPEIPKINENIGESYFGQFVTLRPPDPYNKQVCDYTGIEFIPVKVYEENLEPLVSVDQRDFAKEWFEGPYYYFYDKDYYVEVEPENKISNEQANNAKQIIFDHIKNNENQIYKDTLKDFIYVEDNENPYDDLPKEYDKEYATKKYIIHAFDSVMQGEIYSKISKNPLSIMLFNGSLNELESPWGMDSGNYLSYGQSLEIVMSRLREFLSNVEIGSSIMVDENTDDRFRQSTYPPSAKNKYTLREFVPKYVSLEAFEDNFAVCKYCDENWIPISKWGPDEPCAECQQDMGVCQSCDKYVHYDSMVYEEGSDESYCEDCYNEIVTSRQIDIKSVADENNMPLLALHEYFRDLEWDQSYGGPAWANITAGLIELKNASGYQDEAVWIDHVVDLQHNTGNVFNKSSKLSRIVNNVISDKTKYNNLKLFSMVAKNELYPEVKEFIKMMKKWEDLSEGEKLTRILERVNGTPKFDKNGNIDLRETQLIPEYYLNKYDPIRYQSPSMASDIIKMKKTSWTNSDYYDLDEEDLYNFYAMTMIDPRLIKLYPPMAQLFQSLTSKIKSVFISYLTKEVYEEALDTRYPRIPYGGAVGGNLYHFLEQIKDNPHVSFNFEDLENADEDEDWYQELVEESENKPVISASFKNLYRLVP